MLSIVLVFPLPFSLCILLLSLFYCPLRRLFILLAVLIHFDIKFAQHSPKRVEKFKTNQLIKFPNYFPTYLQKKKSSKKWKMMKESKHREKSNHQIISQTALEGTFAICRFSDLFFFRFARWRFQWLVEIKKLNISHILEHILTLV